MNSITKEQAHLLMLASKGTTFTVTYIKKDGSTRVLNGRSGVGKYVNGKGLKYDPAKKGLLPIYDMQIDAHRMINLHTVKSLKVRGHEYQVGD